MILKYYFIVVSLLSFSSWACPDISGSYSCFEEKDSDGLGCYKLDIMKSGMSYTMSYNGNRGEIYVADGVTREVSVLGSQGLTVSCDASSVNIMLDYSSLEDPYGESLDTFTSTRLYMEDGKLMQKMIVKHLGKKSELLTICLPLN